MQQFTDLNGQKESGPTFGREKRGCWVSPLIGFFLVLLAGTLAVVVGVLVHLLGPSYTLSCECGFADTDGDNNALWERCQDLAGTLDECLASSNCPPFTAENVTSTVSDDVTVTSVIPTKPKDVRLPSDLEPVHYDLELWPHLYSGEPSSFHFNGSVRIFLNCVKETDVIIVHINHLVISDASLEVRTVDVGGRSGSVVQWLRWELDEARQFFKLYMQEDLEVGRQYAVRMTFTGPLREDLVGLYVSSYERDGKKIWLATTQMQPTDARKAFPCLDEPALKATFNITLVRKYNMTALSNTEIAYTQPRGEDWMADHFKQTVKMPTYLLAFVISDFSSRERTTTRGSKFRVWARPSSIDLADYALDVGTRILQYFEDYFDIPFPLEKQDMIAVPDFAAGAMENWGLIIYRETAMLYDPLVSSSSNKQRVAVVVSHELAHQWFGNLVTPSWWDDLWLNEGFASYVEFLGVNFVHPDWLMNDQFISENLHAVFQLDQLSSSHPIYIPVGHPDEINEIFDSISYGKGAAIIRMMNYFLGEETFKRGLTRYLRRHAYGNAHHIDLWKALTEQSRLDGLDLDVRAIMDTWVLQMGFPVVKVTRDSLYRDIAQVTQKHFLADPTAAPDEKYLSPFGYKWTIPLTYTLSSNPNWTSPTFTWMNRQDVELIGLDASADWLLANIGQFGYYRVNYDLNNWHALLQQLSRDHTVIPVKNRAQIIDDLFNLGRSGEVQQLLALEATRYLTNETEYLPWNAAVMSLRYVSKMFQQTASYGDLQKYMVRQITPLYNWLNGWNVDESESLLQRYLRDLALYVACSYGHKECQNDALALYRSWMEDPVANPVPADLKSVVYCQAIRRGGVEEWDFAYEQYKVTDVASEKIRLLRSLACTDVPWLLSKYIEITFDEVRRQDGIYVLGYISSNSIGRHLVWDTMRERWPEIMERYGSSFFALSRFIETMTSSFNTPFQLQEVEAFIAENEGNLGAGERAFDQAVEKIKGNIAWMNANQNDITQFLQTAVAA